MRQESTPDHDKPTHQTEVSVSVPQKGVQQGGTYEEQKRASLGNQQDKNTWNNLSRAI